jgi:hypothetical protein
VEGRCSSTSHCRCGDDVRKEMSEKKLEKNNFHITYNTNDNSRNIIFKCMPIALPRIFFDATQLKKQGPSKILRKRFENN